MDIKRFDIVALGECLIDFVYHSSGNETLELSGNPGGAPANMLAAACKFDMKCAFIGKVGNDVFGERLKKAYSEVGIDTTGMITSEKERTTLAFVILDESGDRDFFFYRNQTADCMISAEELDKDILLDTNLFHFGSISMTDTVSKEATLYAIRTAKEGGAIVSFDPNYRAKLWSSEEDAKEAMFCGLKLADIVKISEEELFFISGYTSPEQAASYLLEEFGISILVVTKGRNGSVAYTSSGLRAETYAYDVDTVDTTGAGDAFFGAFIANFLLCGKKPGSLDKCELEKILTIASANGSLSTTKYGAIPAMPTKQQVTDFLKDAKFLT